MRSSEARSSKKKLDGQKDQLRANRKSRVSPGKNNLKKGRG